MMQDDMGELGLLILEKGYGRFDNGRPPSLDKLHFTQVHSTTCTYRCPMCSHDCWLAALCLHTASTARSATQLAARCSLPCFIIADFLDGPNQTSMSKANLTVEFA